MLQYYLTRGWDYANLQKDPSTAKQHLIADLENGQVFPGVNCPSSAFTSAVATVRAPSAPQRSSPSVTPSLQALEADPAHFGVAWARRHPAR